MISRRKFLSHVGPTALAIAAFPSWIEAEMALEEAIEPVAPASTALGYLDLRLEATRLAEMADFYSKVIGWSVEALENRLTVQAGGTLLHFEEAAAGTAPYYHLAWAIPPNQFEAAKRWLAARTPLLVHPDGRDEFDFRSVNRRGVYFADPAGNILELIARGDLGDEQSGSFGLDMLLYVNHAGLVVDDMNRTIAELERGLDLAARYDPTPTFTILGDAHRHLVLVPQERLWIPEMSRPAAVFPLAATLHGSEAAALEIERLNARIAIAPHQARLGPTG